MSKGPLLALGFALCALPAAAQTNAAMPPSASTCLACHSVDGRPVLPDVPIIAGQQVAYLVNALTSYRDGHRTGGQALVMQQFVKDLSDAQIRTLAVWFGGAR
jgi:cytochrome c553